MQRIITEKIGDKQIILLQGNVDAADHRLFRRFQSPRNLHQEYRLWIDCTDLECIKDYGFCHFVNQLLLLRNSKASITLMHLSTQQRQLLRLLKLDSVFTVVDELKDAYQLVMAS
ncbi:hypothetical protein [Rufibacter immobilis]|uniref:hypothetical protein n=1 Tax=Rufibacter immobilis TaxID=1348778 RepID=UPI0035E52948